MPSRDAIIEAQLAAGISPATGKTSYTGSGSGVDTSTLAGIQAASTPVITPVIPPTVTPTGSPGKAWVWNGSAWARPAQPTGGKTYTWDDTNGWIESVATLGGETPEQKAIRLAAEAKAIADAAAAKAALDAAAKLAADAAAKTAADKAAADAARAIQQTNAITSLTATFNAMGLGGDIAAAITDMVQKGYTTDTIMMIAQDPTSKDPVALAFQKRFPANADRIKAGLPPLSPADYMLNEKAYRAAMQQAGLPKGFYDSQQDFTKFIANDVSPSELQSRINTAADAIANADPFYTSSLKAMYGLTTGDMIAHALDPQAALPLLQKQAEALKIGTAAARQGWGISATGAENLYTQGVTAAQAASGFKTVAGMQTDQQRLAEIWGGDTAAQGQNLVAATFGTAGAAYADQQIKALQQKEINAFTGGSGVAKGSLGVSTEQTGGNL